MKSNRITKLLALASVCAVGFSMTVAPAFAAAKIVKDETVYVVTDSTGKANDIIVSDKLKNNTKAKTINDKTDLTDIENLKGKEKFKQNGDDIVWVADGNDITYQGKTDKSLPIILDVSYYLDGKYVEGQQLKDATGDVRIELSYYNKARQGGHLVPFIVMSGFMADSKEFHDIKVKKGTGKILEEGDSTIIIGMAAPGLADELNVDVKDIGLEDTIVIEGKAEGFSSQDIMTIATCNFAEDLDNDLLGGFSLDSDINKLNNASKRLVEGSNDLYEGIHLLYGKSDALKAGVDQLNSGAGSLSKGSKDLKNGSLVLFDGTKKLKTALKDAENGAGQIYGGLAGDGTADNPGLAYGIAAVGGALAGDGTEENPGLVKSVTSLAGGAANVSAGIAGVNSALKGAIEAKISEWDQKKQGASAEELAVINAALDTLNELKATVDGATGENSDVYKGAAQVAGGLDKVKDGLGQLSKSVNDSLVPGVGKLKDGSGQLYQNLAEANGNGGKVDQLVNGAQQISDGADKLSTGAAQLAAGMSSLSSNTDALIEGVGKLDEGSETLKDGMAQFYKEGIKKIVDLYNDNIKGLVNGTSGVIDAGKAYKSFTKIGNDMDGSVKFIIKTEVYTEE